MFLVQCLFFGLQISSFPCDAWDTDLELFDLVDAFSQNFYEFLSVEQDASLADIRKAYRRLSLTLHPDKNKEENAETQFRQLVAIYEVLKDDERRQRYNDILVNGLPDWRQPVYYYRRVRQMSNGELGFLLCLFMSVGHYAVIWSIYLEKQLDEFLSKKKKEKKKKIVTKTAEETRCNGQDKSERSHEKPQWHDILPLKLSIGLYVFFKSLPHAVQEAKQYYEFYQKTKLKEQEEAQIMAEIEATQREKRPKVKKPKFTFPVYEASGTDNTLLPLCGTSIEEIEDQLEDWLDYKKPQKISEWTDEEISQLTRTMAKFPGGTPGRWEKIAHELDRSVTDVTSKVKQVKESVNSLSGLVKFSELKGITLPLKTSLIGHGADNLTILHDDTQSHQLQATDQTGPSAMADVGKAQALRRRLKKTGGENGDSKGRRQRDFDTKAVVEDSEDEKSMLSHQEYRDKTEAADTIWTQNQQKWLELALQQYPRGTTERWERIALMVPGKTKEECMVRYKLLAELVKKKKQAKS